MSDERKPDRRVERTRATLLSAFNALVLERGYDRFTIRDISERAGVGRSTFYEHFEGKEDVLEQTVANPLSLLASAVEAKSDVATLSLVVRHFREQKALTRTLLGGSMRAILSRVLRDLIEVRLRPPGSVGPELPLALIAAYVADGQLSLLESWLADESACSAEALARAIATASRAAAAALVNAT